MGVQTRNAAVAAPVTMMPGGVEIRDLSKWYNVEGRRLMVLDHFSLSAGPGEFVTLFGPNGSGKTTLLRVLAGLDKPSEGTLSIGGRSPSEAAIAFVFQNYRESLFPWRTVADNLAFPLELQGRNGAEIKPRVDEILGEFGLREFARMYPYQLSGGKQQLVAIGRALAQEPDILLLDEPFSALDYHTRLEMEDWVLRLRRRINKTVLFVSHDLDEALLLGDRVAFLSQRPARILTILEPHLPPERSVAVMATREFEELRSHALTIVGGQR